MRRLGLVGVALLLGPGGCGGGSSPSGPSPPSGLAQRTAALTQRLETANFVFHYAPGDQVQADRSEAFHRWAVGYLGVSAPKKIDFYKFPSSEQLEAAMGERFGGRAYPREFAVVTAYPWHNHECMHLYVDLIGSPPRLFAEGMVVAHEYDPLNGVWVSQWNRADPPDEPYLDIVRDLRIAGRLYPIEQILESEAFNARVGSEQSRVGYPQAGVFVMYLIQAFGLEPMKEVVGSVPYAASREAIGSRFEAVFGVSVATAERAWLDWLDQADARAGWRPGAHASDARAASDGGSGG